MPIVSAPRFLSSRPRRLHSTQPWSQFRHVNHGLVQMVRDLTESCAERPGARVLDYGCATQPYRALLPGAIDYVGVDLPGNPDAQVDLRPDGSVPLPPGTFDVVLSTQVLEHVTDPDLYVAECARLLRPGGSLVLSTHGTMYYHRDPEDYWRWTMAGLTLLVERHGLRVVQRRGVLSLSAAAVQVFQDATVWSLPRLLRPLYLIVLQAAVGVLDRRATPQAREDNGMVVALRAERPA